MTDDRSAHERFVRLGPFVVDVLSGEIKRNGERIRLPEQPTRLLLTLLEKRGEIVSREELRTKLWPDDTNVEFSHSIHAAINKLRQALGDSPEQPQFIETIPRRGYRLVESAAAATALTRAEPASEVQKVAAPAAWRRNTLFLIVGTVLVALVSLLATRPHFRAESKSQSGSSTSPIPPPSLPRRVAIVGFRNLSNREDANWLSTAFSEMLATELGSNAALQPVSGEDVAQMKRELLLPDADSFTQQTLGKIRQNVGAELVVVGSFILLGTGNPTDQVRFNLHFQDTRDGQTMASWSETGKIGDLLDLISDAGLRLRLQLGATPLSSSEQAQIRSAMPANDAARSLYFSGLEKLRNFEYPAARQVLVNAVMADRKNPLAHEGLSAAYSVSGYESQAAKEAKLAFDLAKGLTYEQGLQIEGRYYEADHAWSRAEETYKRLCSLSPQTLEFSLRLARAQGLNGKPDEALATLDHLRPLPGSAKDRARIYLAEASEQQLLGDFNKELTAARAAAVQGAQAQAPMVIALALRSQGVALGFLGDSAQALNKDREAESIFENLNELGGLLDAQIEEGDILSDQGEIKAAETVYRKALVLAHTIASKQHEATISNNLGNILLMRGEPAKALEVYRHSYEILREVEDKTGQANSLLTMGDALQDGGELSQAESYYERSSRLATEIANQAVRAAALQGLAGTLLDKGDLVHAKQSAEESVTIAQASGDKATETAALIFLGQVVAAQGAPAEGLTIEEKALHATDSMGAKSLQAWVRVALGQILLMQGNTAAARANFEQALMMERSINADTEERETRYLLAELAIEEHRVSDAREMLRFLLDDLRRRQDVDTELECLILEARLDLLEKHNDIALKTGFRASTVSVRSQRLELQVSAAEVLAHAAAASREWAQADRLIRSAVLRASQSGCVACQLKMQLSQCELKVEKEASDASSCFEELHKIAESRGFGRIAKVPPPD